MKKLVLFVATIATFTFAACTNKQAQSSKTTTDTSAVVVEEEVDVVTDTAVEEAGVPEDNATVSAN